MGVYLTYKDSTYSITDHIKFQVDLGRTKLITRKSSFFKVTVDVFSSCIKLVLHQVYQMFPDLIYTCIQLGWLIFLFFFLWN